MAVGAIPAAIFMKLRSIDKVSKSQNPKVPNVSLTK